MSNYFILTSPNILLGDPEGWSMKVGDSCDILMDDVTLCKGYLDSIQFQTRMGGISLTIHGRDTVCDLIDCSYGETTNEWKNQSIRSLITTLCRPFSITVTFDTGLDSVLSTIIDSFKADEGDTIYALISRLCFDYGLLATSLGDGKLTITRISPTIRATDVLKWETNILESWSNMSNIDRYSEYIVKGMGVGSDTKGLADFVNPYGKQTDTVIARHRPLVILTDSPVNTGACQIRAKAEANMRAGFSRKIFYRVDKWIQTDGSLWDVNQLVQVDDVLLDFQDTLLIDSVDYINQSSGIQQVVLGLVDKRTYKADGTASQIKGRFD